MHHGTWHRRYDCAADAAFQIEHALESLKTDSTVSFDAKYQGVYNKWLKAANQFFTDPKKRGRMDDMRRDHLRAVWYVPCDAMA